MPLVIRNDIRYWRRKRGLTQTELAAMVERQGLPGFRQQRVSEFESGLVLPDERELDALCAALNVRRGDLYRPSVIDFVVAEGEAGSGRPPGERRSRRP